MPTSRAYLAARDWSQGWAPAVILWSFVWSDHNMPMYRTVDRRSKDINKQGGRDAGLGCQCPVTVDAGMAA